MNASSFALAPVTRHSREAAVALAAAAFLTLLLSHLQQPLAPLRIMALALVAFAVWAFCDEMGMRKPLNRAGFVFFAFAAASKVHIELGVAPEFAGRHHLLYACFLLASVLLWSVAFMHRQRSLKIMGAVGVVASLGPIVALLVGHIAVGAGTVLGVGAMLSANSGTPPTDLRFVTLVERIFGLWGYITAWLLWRGHIRNTAVQVHAPGCPASGSD